MNTAEENSNTELNGLVITALSLLATAVIIGFWPTSFVILLIVGFFWLIGKHPWMFIAIALGLSIGLGDC